METLTADQVAAGLASAPVAARVDRSGFVESLHRALITVTAPDGSVQAAWGDPKAVIFPRSSNKPLQAAAMLRAGAKLDGELLALACSSHSGESFHLDGVRRILASVGLDESALQNTPDLPYDADERKRWTREGLEPSSIAQNCSGKHAGMLAACIASGWDIKTYRDPAHPLQKLMAQTLAELADDSVDGFGIDGCGAPVMSLSMAGLARSFGRLASAEAGTDEAKVADAIRSAPLYLGGTNRDVSTLVAGVPGLIAKDGAEACYAIGLADGRGIAIKIVDGTQRARPVIAAQILRMMGIESSALEALEKADIMGHGHKVGSVSACLRKADVGALGA